MGTLDVLPLANEASGDEDRDVQLAFIQQPRHAPVRARVNVIRAHRFTGVHISSPTGLSVDGLVRSVSRGGVQISTSARVPIRCALEMGIAGCQPIAGEALYCIKRGALHRVGIVFSCRYKPLLRCGAVANLRSLESPFAIGRASILEVRGSGVSMFGKAVMNPGSWVRIDSSGWILFGVVKELVPTGMRGHYLEIHLEAAFPADTTDQTAAAETPLSTSHLDPYAFAPPDRMPWKDEGEL